MYAINKNTTSKIEVLKSIFICDLFYVTSELDIKEYLSTIKKKYYDARHHVYAYILGDSAEVMKCSDDGEPSKTAGAPILSILQKKKITNVLAIVTRYFGGTLLGTGGLIRAYSNAVLEALQTIELNPIIFTQKIIVICSYKDYQSISSLGYPILNSKFTTDVYLELEIPKEKSLEIVEQISKLTNAKATIHFHEEAS